MEALIRRARYFKPEQGLGKNIAAIRSVAPSGLIFVLQYRTGGLHHRL